MSEAINPTEPRVLEACQQGACPVLPGCRELAHGCAVRPPCRHILLRVCCVYLTVCWLANLSTRFQRCFPQFAWHPRPASGHFASGLRGYPCTRFPFCASNRVRRRVQQHAGFMRSTYSSGRLPAARTGHIVPRSGCSSWRRSAAALFKSKLAMKVCLGQRFSSICPCQISLNFSHWELDPLTCPSTFAGLQIALSALHELASGVQAQTLFQLQAFHARISRKRQVGAAGQVQRYQARVHRCGRNVAEQRQPVVTGCRPGNTGCECAGHSGVMLQQAQRIAQC